MHHQREEFWVNVARKAKVTRDDDILTLNIGETVHIPIEMNHSEV